MASESKFKKADNGELPLDKSTSAYMRMITNKILTFIFGAFDSSYRPMQNLCLLNGGKKMEEKFFQEVTI